MEELPIIYLNFIYFVDTFFGAILTVVYYYFILFQPLKYISWWLSYKLLFQILLFIPFQIHQYNTL